MGKHFCQYYIPNNSDFTMSGCCALGNKKCPYRAKFPEFSLEPTATKQEDCPDYEKWQDPLESLSNENSKS